jgi:hypothetical protein
LVAGVAALATVTFVAPVVAQDFSLAPNYGTVTLSKGFTPDPHRVNVLAGGSIDASRLGNGCTGMIANAPDVRLQWTNTGANTLPLSISVSSTADTTLVINLPDGSWVCDDDSGNNGLNPAVTLANPPSGQYDIWIGTFGSGSSMQQSQLSISELYSN